MKVIRLFQFWIPAVIGGLAGLAVVLSAVAIYWSATTFAAVADLRKANVPAVFSWRQVESKNRDVYMANLRAIGCPEATIAAIVDGQAPATTRPDARPTSVARGENVSAIAVADPVPESPFVPAPVSAPGGISPGGPSPSFSSAAVSTERSNRGGSGPQTAVVARPVRPYGPGGRYSRKALPAMAAEASSNPEDGLEAAGDEVIMAPDSEVAIPQAFQNPPRELSELERKQIDDLQKNFVAEIGGTDAAPPSPEVWGTAQMKADDALRARIGQDAYLAWKNAND